MRILIQGDLFMRVDILKQCVEDALRSLGEPLEISTITLDTPIPADPLPATRLAGEADTWNQPSAGGRRVYEFHGPIDVLVEPVRDVDYMVIHSAAVTEEVLQAGHRLKAIGCGRGGPVNVDIRAATERRIPIIHAPGRNARAVAEFIIGMMLSFDRNVIEGWQGIKSGLWRYGLYRYENASPGFEGRVLGMVGFGRVGHFLAPFAAALGMRLLAYDPYLPDEAFAAAGVEKVETMDALIPQADFVVILARVTPETYHLIGARQIALMKPTAVLVNTARGPLLDYDALYPALQERRIKGALLDCFADEPLPADNPLLRLDNVLLTPHIAGATQETVFRAGQMMAADFRRLIEGQRPQNCLNPSVFDNTSGESKL